MTLSGFPAIIALFIFLAVPLLVIVYVISKLSKLAHRLHQSTNVLIVTEYESPADLSPAEIGYLFDSRLNKIELIATVVDLEQRGYLTIQSGKIGDLKLINNSKTGSLKPHEQLIIDNLTDHEHLITYSLQHSLEFKRSIKRSLASQGFLKTGNEHVSYVAQRTIIAYLIITIPLFIWLTVASGGGGFWIMMGFIIIYVLCFPFFLGLALLAGYTYNKIVGQPGIWTQKLRSIWPEIQGYKSFIQQVELDELKFESKQLKTQSKNKTLPYAIALGMNTDWKKRFTV